MGRLFVPLFDVLDPEDATTPLGGGETAPAYGGEFVSDGGDQDIAIDAGEITVPQYLTTDPIAITWLNTGTIAWDANVRVVRRDTGDTMIACPTSVAPGDSWAIAGADAFATYTVSPATLYFDLTAPDGTVLASADIEITHHVA